jgi:hypothetical protein
MNLFFRSVLLGIVGIFTFGCASNHYNIPREQYTKRVKVLGVTPILVDADSDIRHPEKAAVVALVKDYNRLNEKKLADMIKESGSHFDVRFLAGDADPLFSGLLFRRERRDDAGIAYNKYFYKTEALRDYIQSNHVDAVMVTVISGITRPDKVYSSNLMNYLSTDYNFLVMTSQILDADGTILWEYPNFRQKNVSLPPFMALQYPDFSESEANASATVDVKFKTVTGIKNTLDKRKKDIFRRDKQVSEAYYSIFDDMVSLLEPDNGLFGGSK